MAGFPAQRKLDAERMLDQNLEGVGRVKCTLLKLSYVHSSITGVDVYQQCINLRLGDRELKTVPTYMNKYHSHSRTEIATPEVLTTSP